MAKRKRKPSEKVERILLAARNLFADNGFENTSVFQIAEQANVAGGTVIYHFKTKENLLFILCRHILYNLYKALRESIQDSATSAAALEEFILEYERFVTQNPADYLVLLNADPFQILDVSQSSYLDLKIYQSWLVQLVTDILDESNSTENSSDLPATEASMLIISMLHCAAKNYLLSNGQSPNLFPEVILFTNARLAFTSHSDKG